MEKGHRQGIEPAIITRGLFLMGILRKLLLTFIKYYICQVQLCSSEDGSFPLWKLKDPSKANVIFYSAMEITSFSGHKYLPAIYVF